MVLAVGLGVPGTADAGVCAGFVDVDGANPFCSSVEWIGNRSITLGCTAAQYCPDQSVTRLQMAAFMHRLGLALQPVHLHAHAVDVQGVSGTGTTLVCETDYTADGFSRLATPVGHIHYSSASLTTMFAGLVYSLDDGQTWTTWSRTLNTSTNSPGRYATQALVAPPLVVPVGQRVRFAIRPYASVNSGEFDGVGCELSIRLESVTTGSVR